MRRIPPRLVVVFTLALLVAGLVYAGTVIAATKSSAGGTGASRHGAVRVSANSDLARTLASGGSLPAETVQLTGVTAHLKRGRLRRPAHALKAKTSSGRAAAVRAASGAGAADKTDAPAVGGSGAGPDLTKFSGSAVEGIKFSGLEDNEIASDPLNVGFDLSADTEGVAGPKDYVETVGFAMGVFDKATGALIAAEELHEFFDKSGLGAPCEKATDKGYLEPHIVYDPKTDRYIVMTDTEQNPEELTGHIYCIAVSKTGDPVGGGWYYYAVPLFTGGAQEISHSAVGMWTNGVYLQEEIYCKENIKAKCPGNNELEEFDGTQVWAFNTVDLETGAALEVVTTQGNVKEKDNFKGSTKAESASSAELEKCRVEITFCNEDAESPTPANIVPGISLPPDSSEASKRNEYFLTPSDLPGEFSPKSDGLVDVWQWHVNWAEPGEDWIGKSKTEQYDYQITTPTFFTPNDGVEAEVPKAEYAEDKYAISTAGGHYANRLNSEFDYIKPKPQYTNFGGKESLWLGYATSKEEKSKTVEGEKEAIVSPDRVRWQQVSLESATGAPKTTAMKQTQDYEPAPTKLSRWLPAIGVDKEGDMALGYSATDTEVFPSLYIAGQEKVESAEEGKAKIESLPETLVDEGHGYQTGEYAEELKNGFFGPQNSMSLDPNGCELWFAGQTDVGSPTNEEGEDNAWATQITAFHFKGCTPSSLATEASTSGEGNQATGTATLTAKLAATGTKSGLFGETVAFSLGGKTVGTAVTNSEGVATLAGVDSSTYAAGTATGAVGASYAGAAAYSYGSSSATGNLLVGATQTISFGPLAGKTYGEAPFTVSASASSNEAVTFTAKGTCSIAGETVTIEGAGHCTITATQPGDGSTVLAAPPVSQEFDIAKESQTITPTGTWTTNETAGKEFKASAVSSVPLPCTSENNTGCIYFNVQETEKNCSDVETGETPQVAILAKQTKEYDEQNSLPLCTVDAESLGNQNVAQAVQPITVEITNKGTQTGAFNDSLTSVPPLGEEKNEKVKIKTSFKLTELVAGVEDPVAWTASELPTTSVVVTGTTSQGAIAAASTAAIGTEAATGTVEKITDSAKEEAATCKTPTAGTATVTLKESKSAADGLSAGEIITIEKASKTGYNAASVEIKTTPTTNTFTYCIKAAGETEEKTGSTVKVISSIIVSGTTATVHVTAAPATAFAPKQKVNIAGIKGTSEKEFNNKTFEVLSAPTTTTFTVAVKAGTANGIAGTVGLPNTGAAENEGVATINLATEPATALMAGQEVEVGNVAVATYDGAFKVKEVLSAKSFTYEDAAAKESVASGAGELVSAVAPCTYSVPGYVLKAQNAGKCKIEAKQAGDASYVAGADSLELTISGGAQTLTWNPNGGNISSTEAETVEVTTNSALSPGTITSTTETTCTVGATSETAKGTAKVTVTPHAEGTCKLAASGNEGTPNWAELKKTEETFNVTNAGKSQAITFAEPKPTTLAHPSLDLSATASSGLTVSFKSTTESVCVTGGANGEDITLVGEGTCTISAEQAGAAGPPKYAAASAVSRSFRVAKADQLLVFGPLSNLTYGAANFGLKGTSEAAVSQNAYSEEEVEDGVSTGLEPSYEALGACTVNPEGTVVHIIEAGVCVITASQAGDSEYRAAPEVAVAFEVARAPSTISFTKPGAQTANEPAFSPGATASSGAPVTYTAEGHCTINGSEEVQVTTPGTCTVTAHGVGNADYEPPARVSQSFSVVKAEFTIEKLQKIAGEPSFTKSSLTGEVGQTVDYEVIVRNANAGNAPLEFQPLSDPGCVGIAPNGTETVAAGAEQTYTCEHTLTAAGVYGNEASIEGNQGTGTKSSNKVEVNVPTMATFTIEKLQEIAGSDAGFTKSKLTGEIGQTIDYEVLVKNGGNVPLEFQPLSDAGCSAITPSTTETVSPGGEETYTCSHELSATGTYSNAASIEGSEGTGTKSSNTVEVEVPTSATFTIEKLQEIAGSNAGFTKSKLTGELGQTVDYEIIVKDTGNVSLSFKALSDAGCASISPTGEETLAPGGEQTYTCSHELTEAGTYANEASIEGNEGTGTKTSNKLEVEVPKAEQTIDFMVADHTYGEEDFTISATATSGEPVSFTRQSGECTLSGHTVHITGGGTCTIDANQAGNANYNPAPQVQDTFRIDAASQSIDFPAISEKTYGEADFAPGASASSGLTVSYSTLGECTIEAGKVHITGVGSCTVKATQAGNADYEPASEVERTFTIAQASQTITFNPPTSSSYGAAPFSLSASASSGLSVTFSGGGACTVSPAGLVTITAAGSCEVVAAQAGNSDYLPAPSVHKTIEVATMATNVALTPANASTKTGKKVKFKATVTAAVAGHEPTPGSVSFYVNGQLVHTQAFTGAAIMYTYHVTLPGSATAYPVSAVFTTTNSDYAGSTGTAKLKVKVKRG
jgi:hypothetical protein